MGEDCKLILWDLSETTLAKPAAAQAVVEQDQDKSVSSSSASSLDDRASDSPPAPPSEPAERQAVFHPARRRAEVNQLLPVAVKVISNEPLEEVHFLPEHVVTVSRRGQVKQFDRPPAVVGGEDGFGLGNGGAGEAR